MSENTFWAITIGFITTAFITLVLSMAWYNKNANEQILKADSCDKVVAISGDSYGRLSILCAGKREVK